MLTPSQRKELEDAIVAVLKTCYDPEIPVDIYELGLIYEIDIDDEGNVKVVMTLTTPMCPVAESLPLEVEEKIKQLEGVRSVKVEVTFDPPWSKEMMSEEARQILGI